MKNKRGITLIALIITIIVLLILAGVSISIVVGDNGVITQAQKAIKKSNLEIAKEEVSMAWVSCEADYMSALTSNENSLRKDYFNKTSMDKYLGGKGTVEVFDYGKCIGGGTEIIYTKTETEKYKFQISSSGRIEVLVGTADSIANELEDLTNVKKYYGKSVMYKGSTDWKIFYVGNEFDSNNKNHIYLIYSGSQIAYTPNQHYGTSADNTFLTNEAKYLSAWWNEYGDNIVDTTITGKNNNTNARAVAYMLNPNNWNGINSENNSVGIAKAGDYLDSNVADWAIGSPTEDMFLKSWNQSQGVTADTGSASDVGFTYKTSGTDFNEMGYIWNRVGKGKLNEGLKNEIDFGSWSPADNSTAGDTTNTAGGNRKRDGHFLKGSNSFLECMYNPGYNFWLASPSTCGDGSVRFLNCKDGNLDNYWVNYTENFIRPIVCIRNETRIVDSGSNWILIAEN